MSMKTKIVVVKLKELLTFTIIGALSILLIILVILFFFPKKSADAPKDSKSLPSSTEAQPTFAPEDDSIATYTPGIYNASIILGDTAVDIEVAVDEHHINSISLVNLEESVDVMYPLVKPAMEELSAQILEKQSLDEVTYSSNNQYTSLVLLSAIDEALKKASPE